MIVEFTNIPVTLDAMLPENDSLLLKEIARACGISVADISDVKLLKKSVDARKKSNVHFVLNIALDIPKIASEEEMAELHVKKGVGAKPYKAPEPLCFPDCSSVANKKGFKRPIVVGAGPAGLFTALYLAKAGLKPILVERGQDVQERRKSVDSFFKGGPLNPDSNVQFGEGGAGTFSDGKLNTGTKSPHIRHVLEQFVECGAPKDILVNAKPHIGTDILSIVVRNMREQIIAEGGEVVFSTRLEAINVEDDAVAGAVLRDLVSGEERVVPTDTVVLAIGHSARDTFKMLHDVGAGMKRKPFAVGVRIEHLQSDIDRAQYGKAAGHPALDTADYKLAVHNADGRGVYTFCMCPGGTVVAAASEEGGVCVNGMSIHARDGQNSNSALLVGVSPEDLPGDDVFEGCRLQRKMEQAAYNLGVKEDGAPYTAPAQTLGDFLASKKGCASTKVKPTYPRGVAWQDLHDCLPEYVSSSIKEAMPALDRKLHGFADPQAVLTGVEARSSSPICIVRDEESMQSVTIAGLYPAGEGAGYAGGIMSAAVDGIRVAQAVCRKYD